MQKSIGLRRRYWQRLQLLAQPRYPPPAFLEHRNSFGRFLADHSLPDLLMPVELRSPRRSGVIAVPDLDVIQPDGGIEMLQRHIEPFFADNVVSRCVRVAGVNARSHRNRAPQTLQNLRHLLEAAAQRELRSSRVFDQDCQASLGKFKPLRRCCDRSSGTHEPLLAVTTAKGPRVQHQVPRAQSKITRTLCVYNVIFPIKSDL